MSRNEETINVRLRWGREAYISWIVAFIFLAVVLWITKSTLDGIGSLEQPTPEPYTLDFRSESAPLSLNLYSGWSMIVVVEKGDVLEHRIYDRETGRHVGTVLTKAQPNTKAANQPASP
ncbi:MAG: hypothetical protein K2Q06_13130 [Parvularculaceae bacterium]|nr:hypothetical protein [Parvularculaceae bacterium]